MSESEQSMRERIAQAIHDGPAATTELLAVGVEHPWSTCPHQEVYLADADAVIAGFPLLGDVDAVVEAVAQEDFQRAALGESWSWYVDRFPAGAASYRRLARVKVEQVLRAGGAS